MRYKRYVRKKPYGKKRSPYRKYSYKNKFNRSKVLTARTNAVRAPFGNTMYTALTYSVNFRQAQASAGLVETRSFIANSAYDPDVLTGGTSSRYFSTLCGADGGTAPYRQYRVLGVKVTATAYNNSTDGFATNGNCLVGARLRLENAASNATIDEIQSSINSSYKYLGVSSGNKGVQTIKLYKKVNQILGIKDTKDNVGATAVYNANPATASRVYLDIDQCSIDDLGISNISWMVKIKQYIQFLTPNSIIISS